MLTCPLATVIAFSACARHMNPANANPRAWPAIHKSPPQPHSSMSQSRSPCNGSAKLAMSRATSTESSRRPARQGMGEGVPSELRGTFSSHTKPAGDSTLRSSASLTCERMAERSVLGLLHRTMAEGQAGMGELTSTELVSDSSERRVREPGKADQGRAGMPQGRAH